MKIFGIETNPEHDFNFRQCFWTEGTVNTIVAEGHGGEPVLQSFEILELHRRVLCVIDDLSNVSFVNPEKVGIDETSPLWRGKHDVLLSTASERNEHKTYNVYGLTVQSITESPTENPELSVKTDFFNLTPIPYNADLFLGGNFANTAH